MPAIDQMDTMTDALRGNAVHVHAALTRQNPSLSRATLFNSGDDLQAVTTVIAEACDTSTETAQEHLQNAIKAADRFINDANCRLQMANYWTELSEDSFTAIGGSRSALASHLQQRYHISRETAWQHINIFFAQVHRHMREKP